MSIEYIYMVTVCYIYIIFLRNECTVHVARCGVAMISRLVKIVGLFCKRALIKRWYSAKDTYHFKEPTRRSHPHSYTTPLPCRCERRLEYVSWEMSMKERWGAGVEIQKNVRREIGGCGQVPFNEPYAPLLSTIYDGA